MDRGRKDKMEGNSEEGRFSVREMDGGRGGNRDRKRKEGQKE